MSAAVALLPTAAVVTATWERHAADCRAIIADPALLLDRAFREATYRRENEWKEAY